VIRSGNVATLWGADSPPEDVLWRQRPSFGRGSESMECRRPDVGGAKDTYSELRASLRRSTALDLDIRKRP